MALLWSRCVVAVDGLLRKVLTGTTRLLCKPSYSIQRKLRAWCEANYYEYAVLSGNKSRDDIDQDAAYAKLFAKAGAASVEERISQAHIYSEQTDLKNPKGLCEPGQYEIAHD